MQPEYIGAVPVACPEPSKETETGGFRQATEREEEASEQGQKGR